MGLFLLYESASGFALFKVKEAEEIGQQSDKVQEACEDYSLFKSMVELTAFRPFPTAEIALDNCLQVSEGLLTPLLLEFLQTSFPKGKNVLGLSDEKIATAISENAKIQCEKNAKVQELLRGVRLHFHKFVKDLSAEDAIKAQLGLGHSYSRSKVKFNVNRVDNMIIQSIALIDQIDKDLNTFAMRCREWYSWHFPELYAIVQDNIIFAKLVIVIGDKAKLDESKMGEIEAAVNGDEVMAQSVFTTARTSMGMEIAEVDLKSVVDFASRVTSLASYRLKLHTYLKDKMNSVAPNLAALIGEMVGARLISHAGSLTNLAKYPASTVQILGAEKALFRALKAKGNTPKYGLIFHSTFIGKASSKNKGRISRYLANKCSIASRLDCFTDQPTDKFGLKLREQVEDRLAFYEGGKVPRKNVDVMKEVLAEVQQDFANQLPLPVKREERDEIAAEPESDKKKKKHKKKDKKESSPVRVVEEKKKEKKKEKKDKKKSKKDKK